MKDILNLILTITLTWTIVTLVVLWSPLLVIWYVFEAYDAWLNHLFGLDTLTDFQSDTQMWIEKGGDYGY